MADLAYGIGAYKSLVTGLPELRVLNCYAEASPMQGVLPELVARPALTAPQLLGDAPIRGVYQWDGVLGGRALVFGSRVFVDGVDIGAAPGAGLVRAAAGEGEVIAVMGGGLYRIDGAAVTPVAFPDDAPVADVDFLKGRFLAVRGDTGAFYWSDILDGTNWDGLAFATAERQADPLVAVRVVGDEVYLFGTETVEVWVSGPDPDLAFQPIDGRVFSKGCAGRDTIARLDNTVWWVSPEGVVYRAGPAVPERVSTHSIEEQIAGAAPDDLSAWAFSWRGHAFYALRIANVATYLHDAATGEWCEWKSYGADDWLAHCGQNVDAAVLTGSHASPVVWRLSDATSRDQAPDADSIEIVREFTALLPTRRPMSVVSLEVSAAVGRAPLSVEPLLEMRFSRDGGFTWSNRYKAALGRQGHYRTRTRWLRLGQADAPGMVFEFRLTDEAPWRVSSVRVNESIGGRAR
ncbi:MAG: packaged DNA stabilization protein [Chloracidobacterium sp.]